MAGQEASIPPLVQQREQTLDALAVLLGVAPQQMRAAEGSLAALSLPPLTPGLPSELLTRRPGSQREYYKDDEATASTWTPDGWLRSGDLGYLDDDGFLYLVGRKKDLIVRGGHNVYPTDIERAVGRVEGVRPGCAVAVRLDAGHSRETFAVAVESNAWQDPVEVRRIEHQVAHEVVAEVDMRPRNVVVLGPGTIPKTPSGKLRRSNSVSLVT